MTNRTYRTEFPDFAAAIDTDRLAAHGLADCSWHNDEIPSFDKTVGDFRIVVWVAYPEYVQSGDATHYVQAITADGVVIADRPVYSLDEALDLVDRFTRRAASGIVYVLQHWVDGDWDDMDAFPVYLDEDDAQEALDAWVETVAHEAHYRGEHGDTNPNNYRTLERITA